MKIVDILFKNKGARRLRVGDECSYRPPYHSGYLKGVVNKVDRHGYAATFDGYGEVYFPDFKKP